MARFVKVKEKDDCEVILNLDSVDAIVKRATYCKLWFGGQHVSISLEDFEKIKGLLCPDYPHY